MNKLFKKKDEITTLTKEKSKKVNILFIKSLKLIVYAFDEIVIYNQYFKQLQNKKLEKETIKCILFYKEKKNLIAGLEPAKVVIYDIKDLKELKIIEFKSGGEINDLLQLKGYKDRNDIFVCNLDDKFIYVFDYHGNFLKILNNPMFKTIKHLAFIPSFNILSLIVVDTDKKHSDLIFIEMNKYIFQYKCSFEGDVNNFQVVNNLLGNDTFIINTTKKVFLYKIKDILYNNINLVPSLDLSDEKERMEIYKVTFLKNIGRNYLVLNGIKSKQIYLYKISSSNDTLNYEFKQLYKLLPKDKTDDKYDPTEIYSLIYLSNFDKLTFAFTSDNSFLDIYDTRLQIERNQATEFHCKTISEELNNQFIEQIKNYKIHLNHEITKVKKEYWLKKTGITNTIVDNIIENENTNLPGKPTVHQEIRKIKENYWHKKFNPNNNENALINQEIKPLNIEESKKDGDKKEIIKRMTVEETIINLKKLYWENKQNKKI